MPVEPMERIVSPDVTSLRPGDGALRGAGERRRRSFGACPLEAYGIDLRRSASSRPDRSDAPPQRDGRLRPGERRSGKHRLREGARGRSRGICGPGRSSGLPQARIMKSRISSSVARRSPVTTYAVRISARVHAETKESAGGRRSCGRGARAASSSRSLRCLRESASSRSPARKAQPGSAEVRGSIPSVANVGATIRAAATRNASTCSAGSSFLEPGNAERDPRDRSRERGHLVHGLGKIEERTGDDHPRPRRERGRARWFVATVTTSATSVTSRVRATRSRSATAPGCRSAR